MDINQFFGKNTFKTLFCTLLFNIFLTGAFGQTLPIPDWAKDIGGNSDSKTSGVAVDKDDNVYVSGIFQGTLRIDHSVGNPIDLTSNGGYDIFIAKYTYDGQLIWASRVGGTGLDQSNALAVDLNGNAYMACYIQSSSIDAAPKPGAATLNGFGTKAVLIKMDKNGEFAWARDIGGNDDGGHVATTDLEGNVVFVGYYAGNINLNGYALTSKNGRDGFMVKYNTNGDVIWAYSLGSSGTDEVYGVRTNSNNEIAIMGYHTGDIDLNPKGPAFPVSANTETYYLSKYTKDGSLIWSNAIAGSGNRTAGVAINGSDDIYITGVLTNTAVSFNSTTAGNGITLTGAAVKDMYIVKYSTNGTIHWTRRVNGTSSNIYSYNITADVDDNVYIGGYFSGSLQFSDATNNKTLTDHGVKDTFFGKYDAAGNFIWAFNFGSACGGNFGHKIAVDAKKNVLLGGGFCQTVDFNPGNCELALTAKNTNSDAFIAKYNQVKLTGSPSITTFTLPEQNGSAIIDNQTRNITITINSDADITRLTPVIMADIGVISPLSATPQDFSVPKKYIVTTNCQDFTWLVTVVQFQSKVALCSGSSALLSGFPSSNTSETYQWEFFMNNTWISAPGISNEKNYNTNNLENFTGADMIQKIRRRVTAATTFYDSEIEVTIYPAIGNNTISTQNLLYCNGPVNNVLIEGTDPTTAGPETFQWQQSDDGINWTDMANQSNRDLNTGTLTRATYFRRVTTSGTCQSNSNTLQIKVFEALTTATAGADQALCNVASVTLAANTPKATETGLWSVVSPAGYDPFDAVSVKDPAAKINLIANQEIILRWTISNSGCGIESTDEVTLISYDEPVVTLMANQIINIGERLTLNAAVTGLQPGDYTYEWLPASGLENSFSLNPTATPTESQTYTLKVYYGAGCSVERNISVIVVRDLIIPNAFSPNGDGTNDVWNIKNVDGHPKIQILVYNRYGEQVFNSIGSYTSWNGTHKGQPLSTGTYYYVIKLNNDRKTILKGALTIIR